MASLFCVGFSLGAKADSPTKWTATWNLSNHQTVDFPIVPAELTTLVNKLFEYIQAGTGILNFFVPFDVIRPAIDVFLAVWAVEHAYQLVLWVLRKVPILGIK